MAQIPLEDSFADILGKALRGSKLPKEEVASKAEVSNAALESLLNGEFDPVTVQKVAPVVGLSANALAQAGRKSWRPEPIAVEGLAQFNTPYEDMTVNAYLVWDPKTREAVAFDTGADATEMLDWVKSEDLKVTAILLTHTHGDHIFDLDRLKSRTGAPAFVGDREPIDGVETFHEGRTFTCGNLRIESRLTWGHSKGGLTYVISGLSRPVAVVGDAVFAGSMGGGGISYQDALATNRSQILTLPDETVICPGHGPLTTVAEEKRNNPFFAA